MAADGIGQEAWPRAPWVSAGWVIAGEVSFSRRLRFAGLGFGMGTRPLAFGSWCPGLEALPRGDCAFSACGGGISAGMPGGMT